MAKKLYTCEICGETTDVLYTVLIENTLMRVCKRCKHLGREIKEEEEFIVRKHTNLLEEEELQEEVREDYGNIIKEAILKKYGDIKLFCKKHNLSYHYIMKIIHEELIPTIEEARKLERMLNIELVVYEKKDVEEEMVYEKSMNDKKDREDNLKLGMFIKDDKLKKMLKLR